jgi:hypothetical protein
MTTSGFLGASSWACVLQRFGRLILTAQRFRHRFMKTRAVGPQYPSALQEILSKARLPQFPARLAHEGQGFRRRAFSRMEFRAQVVGFVKPPLIKQPIDLAKKRLPTRFAITTGTAHQRLEVKGYFKWKSGEPR